MTSRAFLAVAWLFGAPLAAIPATAPGSTVDRLDLERWTGTWYVIGRNPNPFEKGLVGTTVHYEKKEPGVLRFVNRGFKERFGGKLSEATGTLTAGPSDDPGKMKIRIFGIIPGDYWVHAVHGDYEAALVGGSKKKSLWLLSRKPALEESVVRAFMERAASLGYDLSGWERVPQNP